MTSRILVAFDESPQAKAALRHALERYPDAEVTVVHVTDPGEWIYPDELGGSFYAEGAFEAAKETAEALLEEASAIAAEADREVRTVADVGPTAATIVECAQEHEADLIVLGSHGRRGLARFLLGSVAERVARRAPVSVTVIREPVPEADD